MIADEARRRGYKKAFFVTDADLVRFGVASKIEEVFRGAGIPYEIFTDVKANPTIANVQPPSRLRVPTSSWHWAAARSSTRPRGAAS